MKTPPTCWPMLASTFCILLYVSSHQHNAFSIGKGTGCGVHAALLPQHQLHTIFRQEQNVTATREDNQPDFVVADPGEASQNRLEDKAQDKVQLLALENPQVQSESSQAQRESNTDEQDPPANVTQAPTNTDTPPNAETEPKKESEEQEQGIDKKDEIKSVDNQQGHSGNQGQPTEQDPNARDQFVTDSEPAKDKGEPFSESDDPPATADSEAQEEGVSEQSQTSQSIEATPSSESQEGQIQSTAEPQPSFVSGNSDDSGTQDKPNDGEYDASVEENGKQPEDQQSEILQASPAAQDEANTVSVSDSQDQDNAGSDEGFLVSEEQNGGRDSGESATTSPEATAEVVIGQTGNIDETESSNVDDGDNQDVPKYQQEPTDGREDGKEEFMDQFAQNGQDPSEEKSTENQGSSSTVESPGGASQANSHQGYISDVQASDEKGTVQLIVSRMKKPVGSYTTCRFQVSRNAYPFETEGKVQTVDVVSCKFPVNLVDEESLFISIQMEYDDTFCTPYQSAKVWSKPGFTLDLKYRILVVVVALILLRFLVWPRMLKLTEVIRQSITGSYEHLDNTDPSTLPISSAEMNAPVLSSTVASQGLTPMKLGHPRGEGYAPLIKKSSKPTEIRSSGKAAGSTFVIDEEAEDDKNWNSSW